MPSTAIQRYRYNPGTGVLVITFVSGKTYAYKSVPADLYIRFLQSGSKGRFFNQFIRNQYDFVHLAR